MRRLIFLAAVCMAAGSASASLIGDEIDARWQFETVDQTTTYLVGPGIEGDPWVGFATLDIDANSFGVDYTDPNIVGQADGTVWTFSDLDWIGTPGEIIGFDVSTNWTGWSDDFVTFGTDFVRVDFLNNVGFDGNTDFWVLELETKHDVVIPEPSAALTFGLGAIVVGSRIRSRRISG